MWLLDSTTQSGKDSCPATTRNAANRSSGEIPGSLIWFMCFLFLLFPIASPKLIEPALLFTELVVGSAFQPPDGFDTGRSFLTTRLNQLGSSEAG